MDFGPQGSRGLGAQGTSLRLQMPACCEGGGYIKTAMLRRKIIDNFQSDPASTVSGNNRLRCIPTAARSSTMQHSGSC